MSPSPIPSRSPKPRFGTRAAAAVLLLMAVALGECLSGCAEEGTDSPQPVSPAATSNGPVLLIGLDGVEWSVVLPMLRAGRLPVMAALMERGTYGFLRTFEPTLSPPIWTSIATGKRPEQHGISNFAWVSEPGQPPQLFTNRDRRTKAIWNIASDCDKRVAVVGWWMTFPVEPVNGVMVAQTNTPQQLDTSYGDNIWKGQLVKGVPGQVYPPERQDAVMTLVAGLEESLPDLTARIFGEFQYPLSPLGARLWHNTQWSFRADAAYARVAGALLSDPDPFDLFAVYFGGSDVVGHRFWRYMAPERYAHPPSPEEIANFEQVIQNYYAYLDGVIGRLVERAGPRARVFVVSDHGMKPINTDAPFDPESPPTDVNSAHHKAAEPGLIIAAGPDIRRLEAEMPPSVLLLSDLRLVADVLDIAPTVLALLDIPAGEDMPGQVRTTLLEPAFLTEHPPRTVATHDTESWLQAHRALTGRVPDEDERLEQLRALGYIEDDQDE